MIIGIDVDGVLRDFDNACIIEILMKTPIKRLRLTEWDLEKRYIVADDSFDVYKYIFEEKAEKIFLGAEPYEGVEEVLPLIRKWAKQNDFRISIVTTQIYDDAKRYTVDWLINLQKRVGKFFDDLIFTDKKHLYVDILLDDNLKNLEEARKYGKIAVAMARPYNRLWTGVSVLNLKGFYNFLQQRSWEYE